MSTTDTLIADLKVLSHEFGTLLSEEGSAIRAANFARAISMQDRKIQLHKRLSSLLELVRTAPKTDLQREEIRIILTNITSDAKSNEKALEFGFNSIERLVGRIMSIVRRALHKDTPRYNSGGAYHLNRKQSLVLQTDETA